MLTRRLLLMSTLLALTQTACAQEAQEPDRDAPDTTTTPTTMSLARLGAILERLDPELKHQGSTWQLTVRERSILVIADAIADRMRVMSAIVRAEALPPELYLRMLQANFDSALDARYAIAQEMLFGVFVHPLGSLTPEFLLSGISQVYGVAETFGTTFSSGALVFGGGDSNELNRELLEKLQEADPGRGI